MENTTKEPAPRKNYKSFIKWSLVIGIVVVLNLFFNYALYLIWKTPDYIEFCPQKQIVEPINTSDRCLQVGGQWSQNYVYDVNGPKGAAPTTPQKIEGYCNQDFTCSKNFEGAIKTYNRNNFIVLVVLGVLTIVLGIVMSSLGIVSLAFAWGGVLSLIIASIRYWSTANNWTKVIILGLALVALIWTGIKKIRE